MAKRRSQPDHFTNRAKKQGYPARSIFKLREIQEKTGILRTGMRVLDLGASPGSWSKYATQVVGKTGSVVAVDLAPLSLQVDNQVLYFIRGDVFDEETEQRIAERAPYDVVLSDAAPATTGNRGVDTARSAGLAERVIQLATRHLVPSGSFVAKLFQGGEEQVLLRRLRQLFSSAQIVKPKASRKESFEVFLTATGYRGTEIDA
jgi:23S rRNA (uridine2552-2'-O)-methyltransferase